MSRLKTAATEDNLAEFYERLDRINEKGADKAEGDVHKYLEYLLNWSSYAIHSDAGIGDLCADTLKKSLKEKNYSLMQATMNFENKADLLWSSQNGCDHSFKAYILHHPKLKKPYLQTSAAERLSYAVFWQNSPDI